MMQTKTLDGYVVTTIEQAGEFCGESVGNINLLRENGFDWWGPFSPEEENAVFEAARKQTRKEFESAMEVRQ